MKISLTTPSRLVRTGGALVATLATFAGAGAQAPTTVPLIAGLTLTKAARTREGDYETLSAVDAISARGVELMISGDVPPAPGQKPQPVSVARTVRIADLKDARIFKYYFNSLDETVINGTTAIGLSSAVLADLRARGQTRITLDGRRGGLAGLVDDLLGSTAKTSGIGEALGGGGLIVTGNLKVVEAKPIGVSVLVNSARTMLPAWHLRGRIGDGDSVEDADLYILDDPANPITLRFAIGRDTLEVTKIEFPVADASKVMEKQLLESRRTAIYGIYFDFNSATIKPKSEPVLQEIVKVMQREPGWSLKVEGHTDNVGGDAKNLDLSARRAAAVKNALVTLGVPASRLDTAGYGSSVPRETNATLAGRARNRRVELSRQ
ncbi:MAG: OmpA family protein [Gemmatimonadota bacterium]|nr:OmpA family protein [Gemmatimonadota bacterium]